MVNVRGEYVFACNVSELPKRGRKTVQINDTMVLIVVCDRGIYAVENRCPQTGRPIAHGEVLNRTITSPHSGARYNLKSGQYIEGGQAPLPSHWLTVYRLKVVDDKVYVHLPPA